MYRKTHFSRNALPQRGMVSLKMFACQKIGCPRGIIFAPGKRVAGQDIRENSAQPREQP